MTRARANSGQAAKGPVAATPDASLPLDASVLSIIANLEGLDLNGLRRQWRAHLGGEPPAHLPRWLLMKVLAYRLQSDALVRRLVPPGGVHIHTEVRVALREGGRGNRHARCGAADVEDEDFRDNPELNKRIADMTALGRTGLPDDIGPMIASLLSEDNRWINAQRIEVSGGMSI